MTPDDAGAWLRERSGHELAGVFTFGDSPELELRLR